MKKFSVLVLLLLLLVACGNEEDNSAADVADEEMSSEETSTNTEVQEEAAEESTKETAPDESSTLTNDNLQKVLQFNGTGEDDTLVTAVMEDAEVKAVIELAPEDIFSAEELAVTRYSQASDKLLEYEGWETLTIEYVDAGTISMDHTESETNEFGMSYFPTLAIEEKLN